MHNWQNNNITLERQGNITNTFGRALTQYGYANFKFEILEIAKFSEKQELHHIEDMYIIKHGSIKHGSNTQKL